MMRLPIPHTFLAAVLALVLAACAPGAGNAFGPDAATYALTRGLFAGDAFVVREVDSGATRYRIEPRTLSFGRSLAFLDPRGNELGRVDRRVISLTPVFDVYRDDARVATLGQDLGRTIAAGILGDRVGDTVTIEGTRGTTFAVRGDLEGLNYRILRDGTEVASVSRPATALVGLGDTGAYLVEIAPGEDDVLLLEIVVAFNELVEAM